MGESTMLSEKGMKSEPKVYTCTHTYLYRYTDK